MGSRRGRPHRGGDGFGGDHRVPPGETRRERGLHQTVDVRGHAAGPDNEQFHRVRRYQAARRSAGDP